MRGTGAPSYLFKARPEDETRHAGAHHHSDGRSCDCEFRGPHRTNVWQCVAAQQTFGQRSAAAGDSRGRGVKLECRVGELDSIHEDPNMRDQPAQARQLVEQQSEQREGTGETARHRRWGGEKCAHLVG